MIALLRMRARVLRLTLLMWLAAKLRAVSAIYSSSWLIGVALVLLAAFLMLSGCASSAVAPPSPTEPNLSPVYLLTRCDEWREPTGPNGDDLIAAWLVNATFYRTCATRVECARGAIDPLPEVCRQ